VVIVLTYLTVTTLNNVLDKCCFHTGSKHKFQKYLAARNRLGNDCHCQIYKKHFRKVLEYQTNI